MYEEIEKVKKNLSNQTSEIYKFNAHDINIEQLISRTDFEEIISDDIIDIKNLIRNSLDYAKLKVDDINTVVTTGGSSLIPSVHKLLADMFGPSKIKGSDAFTSVASGLATIANTIF